MGESIKRSPFFAWEDEFINVTLSLSQQVSNQVIKHLNNWLLPAFITLKCFFCIIHGKAYYSSELHMFNNSKSRQKYSFALGNLLGKATFAISWIVSFKEGKKFLFLIWELSCTIQVLRQARRGGRGRRVERSPVRRPRAQDQHWCGTSRRRRWRQVIFNCMFIQGYIFWPFPLPGGREIFVPIEKQGRIWSRTRKKEGKRGGKKKKGKEW